MAEISKLLEILCETRPPRFSQGLLSGAARPGLKAFLSILEEGIRVAEDGSLGLQGWSRSQIEAVISVAEAIVSASLSISVEQQELLLLAIVQKSLELCICFLEKFSCDGGDFSLQNNCLHMMEMAIFFGSANHHHATKIESLNTLVVLLPPIIVQDGGGDLKNGPSSSLEGIYWLKKGFTGDRVQKFLSLDKSNPDCLARRFSEYPITHFSDKIKSIAQHWAVFCFNCFPRLLILCQQLLQPPISFDEKMDDGGFSLRVAFVGRILKLLGHLMREIPQDPCDSELLRAVAGCADSIPPLLKLKVNFLNFDSANSSSNLGSLLLLVLEEFLKFVQIGFLDDLVTQNVRICILASMLDILDSNSWKYDSLQSSAEAPLVSWPQIVIYMVKLLNEVKSWLSHDKKFVLENHCLESDSCGPSCCAGSTKVLLLRNYTRGEYVNLIFPRSIQWLDGLIYLAFYLHSEGEDLKAKSEKPRITVLKTTNSVESDGGANHEDEALFGDLFCEANRAVGSSDGVEQPSLAVSCNESYHLPIQAASELLLFLKTSIFSPEWDNTIFEHSFRMLNESHLDWLLLILGCQNCLFEAENSAVAPSKSTMHVSEICYELLHGILGCQALSFSMRESFVDKILHVETGRHIYNSYSLALLAHTLISHLRLDGSHLTMRIFSAYVSFVLGKVGSVCSSCPDSNDFLKTLPCSFHLEILLMAFHLSNETEKAEIANFVSSSFRQINAPPDGCSARQLSYWAIVVSKLVLILRHMLLYPRTCPSWLLVRMRSRLREISSGKSLFRSLDDHMPSWASIVADVTIEDYGKAAIDAIWHSHLIDVTPLPYPLWREDSSVKCLGLNWSDISATFSWILDFWIYKKAETVEQLLIERYIFLLCWGTISTSNLDDFSFFHSSSRLDLNLSSVLSFFHFVLTVMSNSSADNNSIVVLEDVLNQLLKFYLELKSAEVQVLGWNFLRKGAWLCTTLSLINSGIGDRPSSSVYPADEPFYIYNPKNSRCEDFWPYMVKSNKMGWLLNLVSSVLRVQLQVLQEAFILVTNQSGRFPTDGFSPILLLKYTGLKKSEQELLLQKYGCSFEMLEPTFGLMSKLEEHINNESGFNVENFWRSFLHGFPSNSDPSSAILLSSAIVVREILCTLEGCLKIKDTGLGFEIETAVLHELLEIIMNIQNDRIFMCMHEKCEVLVASLIGHHMELLGYSDLFALKQIEGLLAAMNSRDSNDSEMHELLIAHIVDFIEALQGDDLKAGILKFYLGFEEGIPEAARELFKEQRGDLLVIINSLDRCHSGTINLKVLNFFINLLSNGLCPGLAEKMQVKFLEMKMPHLSNWLESRLLCVIKSPNDDIHSKGISASLKESTMSFITHLITQPLSKFSEKFRAHIVDGFLMLLDKAFISYDLHTSKAYFSFMLQILHGRTSINLLLEKILLLMVKLVDSEELLPGLKFLFSFLFSFLGDCGANKKTMETFPSKLNSNNSFGSTSVNSKSFGSQKNSEKLVLLRNPGSTSASIECDATSADEDDDDGTSDGDLGSVDKEEEVDGNSEKELASKVCTFTSSGSNFMEQHWYFCYTCDLILSKGCCSICAKVCHKGHRVVYSRSSRFFCDCGAGGVRGYSCQCLKPRKFTETNNVTSGGANSLQSFVHLSEEADEAADSDSELEYDACVDLDNSLKLSIFKDFQMELPSMLEKLDFESPVIEICERLLPALISQRDSNILKDRKITLGDNKKLSYKVDILQLKKAYKSGSLDLKIKTDYPNSKELKSHLSVGSLTKSLLSISVRDRLAVGEGDKVAIFDVMQLIGHPTVGPVTADKANAKPLSRNNVRFEIVHVVFNPIVENYLAVAGYEDCQILTINPRGEVTDRLAIELALQGAYIRRVEWVPGSQVQLMLITNMFVKIYDLSQDSISPMHYFTLSGDLIVDAVLIPASMGKLFLLVFSETGSLFRLEVSIEGDAGVKALEEVIQVQNRATQSSGHSLYFSSTYRLLFLSYQDGTALIGRLDSNVTSLVEVSAVFEDDQEGNICPARLQHWKELFSGSGVFVCFSSFKSNAALAVAMSPNELFAQNLRYAAGSALSLVGAAAYKPFSNDKTHCLVLNDDGSLQIFSYVPVGDVSASNNNVEQTKKLGSAILNNRLYTVSKPEFPLDFFEKTISITADVKMSCDTFKNCDSEGIKQRLGPEDGFLESPSPAGFKITISNTNPDIVMVGIRLNVGNTSPNHIPSEITIFQRVVKLDEGIRSWYDIPFTIAESLLADEEFTISIGQTFDGSSLPRLDSLEVYGRAKDEFGWKEKMDAILDMEVHVLGANAAAQGPRKKGRTMQAASICEKVLADALILLSKTCLLNRSHFAMEIEGANFELNKLKCKNVLETIFQSDKEPLLQSAACHFLQSIFPKREIYYHVKDTMRLSGVVKSFPMLISRIGIGGAVAGWVIKEFTSQMHAVSKIALHRRSNLATFLKIHGSGVVDGLMQVLWGILDTERPQTQAINHIVIPAVELLYSYAECLALHGMETSEHSVAPAVTLLKKLLFSPYEEVQTSTSLAMSSRLLQVPFPKQTMLATDDAAENSAAQVPSSGVTNGGNAQIMMEEDSATSSVQYSCDGCSTVPILRRRWHCNVCPDFDLCEACYEVLDADSLPPHSRDHQMSAIPIEVESIGVDGNDIHFSMDDLNEVGIMPIAVDTSMLNSPSSVHVLETSESGNFSSSVVDQRMVTISASKRTVNSFLLRQLLEELKGWMQTTSGVRAIPVMQLFYRLSSAVGGPFIDSLNPENLDLEKFVKWFLREIDLSKPFSTKVRSVFGEVSILVYMYFTLMLRNWHQPGGDNSLSKPAGAADSQDKTSVQVQFPCLTPPSSDDKEKNEFTSQLIRACSVLRQQHFLNYLMDILGQLVNAFKSSGNFESGAAGSGCGSLLSVRRELPAGNFSPFFSDSYAKTHRADLFGDYHKLLLENTFRLVYSLVRPEKTEKSADKDKTCKIGLGKDLKLDGFQDVFCSYINNPHTTFIRRYARRLFLHLCGSKTHYYSVRDSWQFSNEVKKLYKLVNKTGGFQNPVTYDRSVKLVKCLSALSEVAVARPRNWQKYCLKHVDFIPFLINSIFYYGEESTIHALKLLNLAFFNGRDLGPSTQKVDAGDVGSNSKKLGTQSVDSKKKRKGEDGNESSSDKAFMDMEQAVEAFSDKDGSVLKRFIDSFLLEWNSASVRLEAKCVLYGIWHHGKPSFKKSMLTVLLGKVKLLPMYGPNIVECIELMTWILGKDPDGTIKQIDTEHASCCLTSDVVSSLFDTLHSQNELLANHPNSSIYNTLSGLVEFDGYYLESEPCVACSCPELPYSRMKLESLKSESKFTDNRIIVKCTGSYTIQTVTMNVHDVRKSKSVKVLNLYYNNRPVSDLAELKNNWLLWKRAKSCHLAFNQTELKVEFPIPITACNFMIELDSFYENLQASSQESLQCPRCTKSVTDKHGICSNCHENAYQCRQCRNINYENLDSFLCNECGYSKYGRFEFNFMAKQSFSFDNMENDDDMKKCLAAIEAESENAHRRYQQLVGFKKPLLKLISSIGEHEIDPQQKDTVQQMMVSLPGPSCKINRKIALIGVLYGEKCKAAFDSVSKSVQTLQGLRKVLMNYLYEKKTEDAVTAARLSVLRSPSNCYGCATTFVTQCMELLQVLSKYPGCKKQLVGARILSELFENNIHQGPKTARIQARVVLCAFSEGDSTAVAELNTLIQKKVMYCLEHHRSMDIAVATREELFLLSETCSLVDEFWETRLRVAFQLLFFSIKVGAKHPSISEHVILPCLRIISQACTPPKTDVSEKEQGGKSTTSQSNKSDPAVKPFISLDNHAGGSKSPSDLPEKQWDGIQKARDIPLLSYSEWEKGATYLDFVRRQYKVSQAVKVTSQTAHQDSQRSDYLALKYGLKWKHRSCKRTAKSDFSSFALGSWVSDLILSACSQSIRSEVCTLISLLCPQDSPRRFQLLNLLMLLLPSTLPTGESAAEYFELFFKMIDSEAARLFLTAKGCLTTLCRLIGQEVGNVNSQERSLNIDISQGFILYKLIELLSKFLELPNIRMRFMKYELLSQMLEALLVIRGLIVQKTKLISDCNRLLKDLLDGLMLESTGNKRKFIHACISGLQNHVKEKKGRTKLFILEQLCNMICPSKPEPVYLLILNKAHTQEEFIRGSMTKNPYSSVEIGPLMRDVKNKICHQLDLLGLLEDDYGMELLVAGNIISLDLSISQVYEQVWKKYHSQSQSKLASAVIPSSGSFTSSRDCPPMTVTYRLQGLDGEATEPMIKELDEEREELRDPEVEFAIAGAVRECGGLEVILSMIQNLGDDKLKSNHEELASALNLLMYCCKIRENRRALLRLGALGMLLETARRAFSVEAMEVAEGILLIVESLAMEANESDISITESVLTVTNSESGAGEQAKKIVLMFLERLSQPSLKMSNKHQQNNEMLARILPYLTYGEPAAMEALIQHFDLCLHNWHEFDRLQKEYDDNPKVESLASQAVKQRSNVENFVRVSESLKTSSCGERLKDIILEKGITQVAVQYLRECFTVVGQSGYRLSNEWAYGLKLQSVPLILSMLRGLSKGHLPTQRCIDEGGVLPILHALEGVPGENEIGARAENLLDVLADKEDNGDGFLKDKVRKLRHATRDEMRRRALRNREELLLGLGMRQEFASDGGERIVVSQPAIEGLEDVEEEEDGLACMVCREGYNLRPNEMLGVYSYSKRVNLGTISSTSGRGDCVYTTVSHFNIIHFQCHQEAKRADAALRNPKKEWEGATLRNNETLCNSIFPINGPSVPVAQYVRYVDQYWDNLNALGRADGSRLRLLTYDIVLMLARFATGAAFNIDCKGGGRESNARFLPFMIQMASYLLDHGSSNQQQRQSMVKSVAAYLSSSPPSLSPSRPSPPPAARSPIPSSDETIQFMMVNSLLSESYESWSQHRLGFLQRGIYHAYMQHKHGKSPSSLRLAESSSPSARMHEGSSTGTDGGAKLFAVIKPMLVYTGLIEQLQRFFKPSKPSRMEAAEGDNEKEKWELVMKERLVNVREMVGFSKEFLSCLEDMISAVDLQEAFDVMGALGDVLSAGFSSCEDFVKAAISTGS